MKKSYVYIYVDPRNNRPFYAGKGTRNRLLGNLRTIPANIKLLIKDIRKIRKEPRVELLRYGISHAEAAQVAMAATALIGSIDMTRNAAIHNKKCAGRVTSQELSAMLTAKKIVVEHKAILLKINQRYRSDMSPIELYEATRGIWRLDKRHEKAEYAMAVYRGIVCEVYRITKWHSSGTLPYKTRESLTFKTKKRVEFEGEVAKNIRDKYVGFSVEMSGPLPVRYVNV